MHLNEPVLYIDEQGEPAGVFPQILHYVAQKEGWELEYIPCTWNGCLDKVESGELDLAMDVGFSPAREMRLHFTQETVLRNWSEVYTRSGISIRSFLDLNGKRIAVVRGSVEASKLRTDAEAFNILPIFVEAESPANVFDLIERGEADAGVVNRLFGAKHGEGFRLEETGVVLYPSQRRFVGSRERGAGFLPRIDARLVELKKDLGSLYYSALRKAQTPARKPIFPSLHFTAEQLDWLAQHPEIKIGINQAWPPMDYVDAQGRPKGIGVEFINAMNTRLSDRLKIVPLPWTEMYEAVKEKRIDALMDITQRPDREPFFNFTEPYVAVPHVIIASKEAPFYGKLSDLNGKSVGVERGFFIVRVLKEKYPDIKVKLFTTTSDALDAVARGETDAYIGNRAAAKYIIERELMADLKVHGKTRETASINVIGVRKDWPVLRDIFQKVLDNLKRNEVATILKKWADPEDLVALKTVQLSRSEKAWLNEHPEITIAFDGDYAPYSFQDEGGELKGIAVDFAYELARRVGLKLKIYRTGTWEELYSAAQRREVDVIATLVLRPERRQWFEFTRPYISLTQYIIVRKDSEAIGRREQIAGKTVALVKGYSTTRYLLEEFPTIKPYYVDDLTSALEAVSTGKTDATLAAMGMAHHLIAREGFLNLRFAMPYAKGLSNQRFGVRKDWPELASILDKALDSMSDYERLQVFLRWSVPDIAQEEAITSLSTELTLPQLTQQEKDYLNALPPLRVPLIEHQPPLTFAKDGQPEGYLNELFDRVATTLGIKYKRIEGLNYAGSLQALKQGEADLLNDYSASGEKRSFVLQTRPVLSAPFVAVGRTDSPLIRSVNDLRGKRLALVSDFQQTLTIQQRHPYLDVRLVRGIDQAYATLRSNEADYYIDNAVHAGYYLRDKMISDLTIAGELPKHEMGELELRFAVAIDKPLLYSAVAKALDAVTLEELHAMRSKWIREQRSSLADEARTPQLNPEERAWLSAHQVIKVAMASDWAPVEYRDKAGEFQGISVDYLKRLEGLLGVRFQAIRGLSWKQAQVALENKQADMFASVSRTPRREAYAVFTRPYLKMPIRIFARDNVSYIGNLDNLKNKRVAVVESHAIHDWLTKDHPELWLQTVASAAEGLKLVSNGQVDAFVDNVVTATYYLGKWRLTNVRVAGDTPYTYTQAMAVRDDWAILARILQKALDAIPLQERNLIFNRWMSIRFEHATDYRLLFYVLTVAVLILIAYTYWNRRLAREVDERVHAEQRLAVFQYTLDHVNDSVVWIDPDGSVSYVNEQWCSRLGYSREQMMTMKVFDVFPAYDKDRWPESWAELTKVGATSMESQIRTKGNQLVPVEIVASHMDFEGRDFACAVVRDITERKQMEESLKSQLDELIEARKLTLTMLEDLAIERNRAMEASRVKSVFLAGMSHELRTPLNSIIGFTGIILNELAGPLNLEQKKQLKMVKGSAQHLLNLINDVLDISKIEAGELKISCETFSMRQAIEQVVESLVPAAMQKDLSFWAEISPEVDQLTSDERRIRQVLINLCGNAIKFTEEGEVKIRCFVRGPDLVVEVRDSGIGIKSEDLDKLFMPFQQLDGGTSRKYEGTGLGLSICKRVLDLLGGTIHAESQWRKGSTFTVTVPQKHKEDHYGGENPDH